jgi:hypothetical protein
MYVRERWRSTLASFAIMGRENRRDATAIFGDVTCVTIGRDPRTRSPVDGKSG